LYDSVLINSISYPHDTPYWLRKLPHDPPSPQCTAKALPMLKEFYANMPDAPSSKMLRTGEMGVDWVPFLESKGHSE